MLYFIMVIIILIYLIFISYIFLEKNKIPYKSTLVYKPTDITFYWINLEKSINRRNNMQTLFNDYHLKNQRIDAILGDDTTPITREIACALSHRKAIKTFLKSNEDYGIICEDDLSMEYLPYWRENIDDVIKNAPNDWEVIQLAVITFYFFDKKLEYAKTNYIPNYLLYGNALCYSSCLCYIINKKGAFKLTFLDKNTIKCAEPFVYTNTKTYVYKYPMFTYPSNNDSFIHTSHLESHEFSKNIITYYLKYTKS